MWSVSNWMYSLAKKSLNNYGTTSYFYQILWPRHTDATLATSFPGLLTDSVGPPRQNYESVSSPGNEVAALDGHRNDTIRTRTFETVLYSQKHEEEEASLWNLEIKLFFQGLIQSCWSCNPDNRREFQDILTDMRKLNIPVSTSS